MMSERRSRVMPGMSGGRARGVPGQRLKSVDLPTFGLPTMTIFLRSLIIILGSFGKFWPILVTQTGVSVPHRLGRAARWMLQCHTWHRTLIQPAGSAARAPAEQPGLRARRRRAPERAGLPRGSPQRALTALRALSVIGCQLMAGS